MKKNTLYIAASFVIAGGLLGWGVYNRISKENKSDSTKPAEEMQSKSVVKVSTVVAKPQDLIMYINTACTAKAAREVEIVAKASGTVELLKVAENSAVRTGDLLFSIKNDAGELDLENAENELLNAKIEYAIKKKQNGEITVNNSANGAKYQTALKELTADLKAGKIKTDEYENRKLEIEVEELLDQSVGSKEKMLKYSSGLSSKLIAWKQAKLNFENTQISAPFAGNVADLKISAENNLTTGQIALRLVDLSQIKLEIPVLESEVGELKEGRTVKVKFNAFPNKEFKGTIKNISPVIDEKNRTCTVIAYLPNPNNEIKPGMTGNATIEGVIYPNRLLVPREAVIVRDNRKLIFIADNGKAKWLYVKTGLENFDYVEILDQLEVGQQVIVSNNYTLAHDADIKISE